MITRYLAYRVKSDRGFNIYRLARPANESEETDVNDVFGLPKNQVIVNVSKDCYQPVIELHREASGYLFSRTHGVTIEQKENNSEKINESSNKFSDPITASSLLAAFRSTPLTQAAYDQIENLLHHKNIATEKIRKLEEEVALLQAEVVKQVAGSKVVFDREVVERAKEACKSGEVYNNKRIAWELERTAMGDGFFGNALRVAKDIPDVTADDRALLDRYACGAQTSTDHVALQGLANRIYADEMSQEPSEGNAADNHLARDRRG